MHTTDATHDAARSLAEFRDALLEHDFTRDEAIALCVAWYSRTVPPAIMSPEQMAEVISAARWPNHMPDTDA
jgi:hypothetical protein